MPEPGENEPLDLEAAVLSWRKELRANRVPAAALEELERHLRDAIQQQIAGGAPASTAFQHAMSDLGRPDQLAEEFAKNGSIRWWDVLVLALVGTGLLVAYGFLVPGLLRSKEVFHTPLLTANVITFGTGILFATLGGLCGTYVLARRDLAHRIDPKVETLFRRIIGAFFVAVFLGSAGAFVTGIGYARASGVSAPWYDYRHLGNGALLLWSGISLWFIWRGKLSARWHFLSAIIGSLIVSDFLLLRAIVEGHFGPALVVLGIVVYAIQLIPLWRHWPDSFRESAS